MKPFFVIALSLPTARHLVLELGAGPVAALVSLRYFVRDDWFRDLNEIRL